MTIHEIGLQWDCLSFINKVINLLKQNNFEPVNQKKFNPIYGMNNDGTSAFLIYGKIGKNLLGIIAKNQEREIEISQGTTLKKSPTNKQTFKDTEQVLAIDYLHEMIKESMI